MSVSRILLLILVAAGIGYFVMRWLVVLNSPMPADLGIQDGKLRPCPDSPNCVSSFSSDPEHAIEPLPLMAPTPQVGEQLLALLESMPRVTVITAESDYVHAEVRTRLMGFVDDAEFYFDDANGVLHMRSGARLGYSDMGVNRRTLAQIRTALAGQ